MFDSVHGHTELFSLDKTVTQTWGTRTSACDMRCHVFSCLLCARTKIMLWMLPELVRLHFVCDIPHYSYTYRPVMFGSSSTDLYLFLRTFHICYNSMYLQAEYVTKFLLTGLVQISYLKSALSTVLYRNTIRKYLNLGRSKLEQCKCVPQKMKAELWGGPV